MTRKTRMLLAAVTLSGAGLLGLAQPAAADNCDIFINPEDCQNTAWTVGVIATLTGGVAVATVAVATSVRRPGPDQRAPAAPPPVGPVVPPRTPRHRGKNDRTIEGVEVRPVFDAPTISIGPADGAAVRGVSVRLSVHRDPGTQSVQGGSP